MGEAARAEPVHVSCDGMPALDPPCAPGDADAALGVDSCVVRWGKAGARCSLRFVAMECGARSRLMRTRDVTRDPARPSSLAAADPAARQPRPAARARRRRPRPLTPWKARVRDAARIARRAMAIATRVSSRRARLHPRAPARRDASCRTRKKRALALARRAFAIAFACRPRAQAASRSCSRCSRSSRSRPNEGVALMCLAEALLRIPDEAQRATALIRKHAREKATGPRNAGGSGRSLFVKRQRPGVFSSAAKLAATHRREGPSAGRARPRAGERGRSRSCAAPVDLALRLMGRAVRSRARTIEEAPLERRKRREARVLPPFLRHAGRKPR